MDAIRPNPRQPRHLIDPVGLKDLADSIRARGVLQPLLVKPVAAGGYELIAGQPRVQAARLAALEFVPAILRQADELQQLELALIENLQRTDLNPLEAAEGYQRLADEFNLSHEAIAGQVGKSRAAISNTLRLLKLAPGARAALAEDRITVMYRHPQAYLNAAYIRNVGTLRGYPCSDVFLGYQPGEVRYMGGNFSQTECEATASRLGIRNQPSPDAQISRPR